MKVNQDNLYLSKLPDGAVTFYEANSTYLKYKAEINTVRFYSYHRNNGISKIGYFTTDEKFDMLISTDGLLSLMDKINNAYLHHLFNDTAIITLV